MDKKELRDNINANYAEHYNSLSNLSEIYKDLDYSEIYQIIADASLFSSYTLST